MPVFAHIEAGTVVNVVLSSTLPGSSHIDITDQVHRPDIGWSYADGVFTPPPTPPKTANELNEPILRQIAALDAYIPRGLEDLIAGLGFDVTKLPQVQQDRLEQKKALRAQLVR